MAKTLNMPHMFHWHDEKENQEDMLESLRVSVHKNYFTFKSWGGDAGDAGQGHSLNERLSKNFATFRQWNG